jgi:hypothetical protein
MPASIFCKSYQATIFFSKMRLCFCQDFMSAIAIGLIALELYQSVSNPTEQVILFINLFGAYYAILMVLCKGIGSSSLKTGNLQRFATGTGLTLVQLQAHLPYALEGLLMHNRICSMVSSAFAVLEACLSLHGMMSSAMSGQPGTL